VLATTPWPKSSSPLEFLTASEWPHRLCVATWTPRRLTRCSSPAWVDTGRWLRALCSLHVPSATHALRGRSRIPRVQSSGYGAEPRRRPGASSSAGRHRGCAADVQQEVSKTVHRCPSLSNQKGALGREVAKPAGNAAAQRLLDKQEVSGSIPLRPTRQKEWANHRARQLTRPTGQGGDGGAPDTTSGLRSRTTCSEDVRQGATAPDEEGTPWQWLRIPCVG
jgi:hypothetical protein